MKLMLKMGLEDDYIYVLRFWCVFIRILKSGLNG